MNRRTHRLLAALFAVVALAFAGAATAQAADYKIGFVNTERLFRDAAPAKRAQQKLEKEFAARDAGYLSASALITLSVISIFWLA